MKSLTGCRTAHRWAALLITVPLFAAAALAMTASSATGSPGAFVWGANFDGELGNGTTFNSSVPIAVSGLNNVTEVAHSGRGFNLALLKNGTVMAWGLNRYGQLGNGTTTTSSTPVAVKGLSGVTAVSAGEDTSLALLKSGKVMAWGENRFGALGDGTESGPEVCGLYACSKVPVEVKGISEVAAVSGGNESNVALLKSGTVVAWGNDCCGQLGDGTTTGSDVPVAVKGLSGVSAISAGDSHNLALLESGKVMAWGFNEYGELGDGTTTGPEKCFETFIPCSKVPIEVPGLSGVSSISAGFFTSGAVLTNGTVEMWGENTFGELGDGTTETKDVPTPVTGLSEVAALSAGSAHTLAIVKGGALKAWGLNSAGELGDGTTTSSPMPVAVSMCGASATGVSVDGRGDIAVGEPGPACPEVTGVSPDLGPATAETPVTIAGTGFSGATAVRFGSNAATNVNVVSSTEITADAPSGSGTVDVLVTNGSGTSGVGSRDRFSYEGAPELGRCVKVAKGAGKYSTAGCTTAKAASSYEWEPGVEKAHFTSKSTTSVTVETVEKRKLVCTGETSEGEFGGTKEVRNVFISLTGCEAGGFKCSSPGAPEGELRSLRLEGALGIEKTGSEPKGDKIGLDLHLEDEGLLTEYACPKPGGAVGEGIEGTLEGSVIVPIASDKMTSTYTLKYSASKGKQKPEQFVGLPKDVLSVYQEEFTAQGGLKLTTTLTAQEKIEVNAAI